jgi:hypothetical protein
VEIWEAKFAVDTKFARFAVETNPPICGRDEIYPALPKPITVEVSWEAKYVVDTKFAKFAVETKLPRFAAAVALDKYPAVPRPITVDTIFDWVTGKSPLMRVVLRFPV